MHKNAEGVVRWRQRAKMKMISGFGGCCGICGYSRAPRALEFHHLDPKTKNFTFGSGLPRSWSKIMTEAHKCVMLCRNCHAEVHDGITQLPENIRRFEEPVSRLPMRRLVISGRKSGRVPPPPQPEKVPDRPRGKILRTMVLNSSRVAVAKKYGVSEAAVRKWLVADTKSGIYSLYDRNRNHRSEVLR